ncbi:MAG: homoserine kinase [Chthoniobacterales bacterium]
MQKTTVRVPASTSNLGPGFDCLGLALRIYNEVTITRGGRSTVPRMCAAAAQKFFDAAKIQPFRFGCGIRGDVPISRGLGSSVTVRLGTLIGLNELSGRVLNRQQLFQICAALEGHPDNAAPAAFGGFNVVASGSVQTFNVSASLRVVLLVPNFEVKTEAARRLLPRTLAHGDAVRNAGRVAQIVAALASGSYAELRGAFVDRVHQPYRKKLIPHFDDIVAAAEAAGALGAFLSGSGSTIAAFTLEREQQVARAMRDAAANGTADSIVTSADNRGARIVSI